MRKALVMLAIGFVLALSAHAQWKEQLPSMKSMIPKNDIICYGKQEDQNSVVPAPFVYRQWKQNKNSRIKTATFEVTYEGFSEEAKIAFQEAVDIWSTLIESEVPIRISASWQIIEDASGSSNTILGGANPANYFINFDGAQQMQTWYPVALAEKMAKKDLNKATDIDIFAQFNSSYPKWYLGIDGVPQPGKTDFVTVVLHEIGHGLGITKGYEVTGDIGDIASFFSPFHVVYDCFLENIIDKNLVQNFIPPSTALKSELTSNGLFFRTPQLNKTSVSNDNRAILYAPVQFQDGSSVAHLDEASYGSSDINALMTPQIGTAEVHHDPGPIAMKMLADMGWVHIHIDHTPIKNTEDIVSDKEVKIVLSPDNLNGYSYNANEVKLNYTTDGTTFTAISMASTGNANEFVSSIPSTGLAATYGYYISVKDNLNRVILKPGIYTADGKSPINFHYSFETGPDLKSPFINHTAKPFILDTDTELVIEAIISDNIGISSALLEYQINGIDQTPVDLTLKQNSDSTYSITLPLPTLQNGDKIKYRIRAKDSSIAQNATAKPSDSGFYLVNVVGLAPTQDSYANDFNSITEDFFGNDIFSITTPSGFSNGAIHSSHPYPNGTETNFTSSYIYQLKVPIRLKESNATLKFDEIVLVEPGADGSVFGDTDFFDYVVVEGSKDGGITWKILADGYDSRANTVWLTKFNSSNDGATQPNSTGIGDPSLFKQRIIDMISNGNFVAGDEIVIRFRLFTDQLVHGWGWAIDNVKIQIDDTAPTILHNHLNYLNISTPTLIIATKVSDDTGVSKLFVDYKIKNGLVTTEELPVSENIDQYTLNLNIAGLLPGELVEYRIRCQDSAGNEGILPADGYFSAPALNIGAPVNQYSTDFNSVNSDFVGNFFSIAQPSGFVNGAIHSTHPYPNGFGLTNSTSNYIYMLKKSITISAENPYMIFDEIGLIEFSGNGVKDLIVVEGSKDNGTTWQSFLDPYSALNDAGWRIAYNGKLNGSPSLYKSRLLNLTSSGKFAAGDNVLIRFRLTADGLINGWGWSIDNLSIQGPITGIEKKREVAISIYPNPVTNGLLTIEVAGNESNTKAGFQILNAQGQTMITDQVELVQNTNRREYAISHWSDGMYFLLVDFGDGTRETRKFIKSNK